MPDLVDRLALVLGEHMHYGDELHVTYNAMQSGSRLRVMPLAPLRRTVRACCQAGTESGHREAAAAPAVRIGRASTA